MKRRQLAACLLACVAVLLGGCAASTAPGTIGISRPQLLMVPSERINEQAATFYLQVSNGARSAGKLNPDEALTTRVRGIAKKLIAQVGTFKPEAASWAWEINVIESDQLNAFCVPGGKIVVFSGLLRRLEMSDDELAAVLGHEIAHALREHSREKISQAALSDAVVRGSARNAGAAGALANVGSILFVKLPFSREMETEADLMGLELMARAGYDPRNASNVWRKMQTAGGAREVEFLSTHPAHERRIEQVEAAAPRVLVLYEEKTGRTEGSRQVPFQVQPSSVQTPAATQKSIAMPSTSDPAGKRRAALVVKGGQDELQARRTAQAQGCANPRPQLIEKSPGAEVYMVSCEGDKQQRYICEFGNCTAR